ncbi:related to cytidylyltransferase family protein [Cephalotrichum gorgonifer]|uniref:Related to cytidylyltransferase family protein n=1 Tax=Cephalotrichum gorgonifer TaxID=2041049 RepID=A0AAE8SW79_9PEZI|nr:related to cytidylyltransferase family protein [Cephalotrichum gorgonifer]
MTSLTDPRHRADTLSFFTAALQNFEDEHLLFSVLCSVSDPDPTPPTPPPPHSETKPVERLIILDSSFNPPTAAHAQMVLSAVEDYYDPTATETTAVGPGHARTDTQGGPIPAGAKGSARILLLLSVQNADKAPKPASFPQRLCMMYLFAKDLQRTLPPGLRVDVALGSHPYFHSKSEVIAREKEYDAREQIFLAGYDTLIRIFNPKYYTSETMQNVLGPFFERARLRVTLRGGADWGGEGEQWGYMAELGAGGIERVGGRKEWLDRIDVVENKGAVVSSTLARAAVERGDARELGEQLGEGVKGWILGEGLYNDKEP